MGQRDRREMGGLQNEGLKRKKGMSNKGWKVEREVEKLWT